MQHEKVFYDFSIKSINGEMINLSKFENNVILLVNVSEAIAVLQTNIQTYKIMG